MLITPDGYALTNSHVVSAVTPYELTLRDESSVTAELVVSVLIRDGRVVRSYLGITGETWPIHRRVNRYYHLEQDSGVRIAHADPHGPAQHAGLKKDDVLVSLATHTIKDVDDLQHFLTDWPVGIPAEAQVLRGTELLKQTIIPVELKS